MNSSLQLEILSDNRNLKTSIKEAETVITNVKVENLPSYELGMEKGMEKGMEQGVEQGIEQGIEQGMEKIIHQMLRNNSAESVAELTDINVATILRIQKNISIKH